MNAVYALTCLCGEDVSKQIKMKQRIRVMPCPYIKLIRDFLFLIRFDLRLDVASSVWLKSGSINVGSLSFAPRATILDWRLDNGASLEAGIGGISGEGPRIESALRDFGRRIVDARRSLLGIGPEK